MSAAIPGFFDGTMISYGKLPQHSVSDLGVALILIAGAFTYPASWPMRLAGIGLGFVAIQAYWRCFWVYTQKDCDGNCPIAVEARKFTRSTMYFNSLEVNLIGLGYQLGFLLLPTLVPTLMWL